jgi:hypothetical protein
VLLWLILQNLGKIANEELRAGEGMTTENGEVPPGDKHSYSDRSDRYGDVREV